MVKAIERISQEYLEMLACPICNSSVVFQEDEHIKCRGCGEIYRCEEGIPVMLPSNRGRSQIGIEAWNELYEKMSDVDIEEAKNSYRSMYGENIVRYLEDFWGRNEGRIYFEVGCGQGFVGLEMARNGYRVVGLDISIESLKIAKRVYQSEDRDAFFVCGDMLQMPFKSGVFDCIYGGGVIEHVKETEKIVKLLYEVTRDGGSVFNTVPYLSVSSLTYRQIWGNIPDIPVLRELSELVHIKLLKQRHMKFGYEKSFTIGKLRRLFTDVGFKELKVGHFECYLPLDSVSNKRIKELLRLLSRRKPFWPMVYVGAKK